MDLNITVLGSGSSGNAVLISLGNYGILIDAGFSRKELLKRLSACGIDPNIIKALLITHEHSDHISGARVIADFLDIPMFANHSTFQAMNAGKETKTGKKKIVFGTGDTFKLESFTIRSFKISHDAIEPVGFVINAKNINIGYAMDLGYLDNITKSRMKGCKVAILESNHDVGMLMNSTRPPYLKHRIKSRHGHLSNEQAMDALHELITQDTKIVMLGHLSNECNKYSIVNELASKKLSQLERTDVKLYLMEQEKPLTPVLIG